MEGCGKLLFSSQKCLRISGGMFCKFLSIFVLYKNMEFYLRLIAAALSSIVFGPSFNFMGIFFTIISKTNEIFTSVGKVKYERLRLDRIEEDRFGKRAGVKKIEYYSSLFTLISFPVDFLYVIYCLDQNKYIHRFIFSICFAI